ncbi:MAG TPA: CPBP family intramembrane glutamic endopeptidase [Chitinophagaceae bacterium]|nr:CPBP family intramembrane glutamic endopeptidase [Chitinophagaceae bacterium]
METVDTTASTAPICTHCQQSISPTAKYCHHCGVLQVAVPDIEEALQHQERLIILGVFFAIQLGICLFSNFGHYQRGLWPILLADLALSVFTLVFAAYFRKELRPLFSWKHFSVAKALSYASTAIIAAIVVNYLVKWLNKSIFDTESYYYYAFSQLKYAKIVTLLSVALQPAIFEELAFRGVLQQGLLKVTDSRQAIFISAFMFALLHMSFVSFFWLLPFALWLGYVRMKEETIWYGVLIHFCFNSTACFFEFFQLNLF